MLEPIRTRGVDRGLTIIELLVALVLFGVTGATVVNFFGRQMKFRGDAEIQAEMHQGLNAALDTLTRDIRLAGACLPRQPMFVPIDGQDNTSPTPDTITLRTGVVSDNTTCVQATLQTAAAAGATALSVDNLTGFTVNKYAFINGTSTGEYFQVQALSGSSGAGTVTSATGLVNAYPASSGVYALQERVYSIDTASFPTTANAVPTLVVRIDRATSGGQPLRVPVAANIDRLDIQYRQNENCTPGPCTVVDLPADNATWNQVGEVLITLRARSNVNQSTNSPYFETAGPVSIQPRNLLAFRPN
jgi:prepilin-type N-terminal cleavage/methylation domain-containing protein